MPERLLCDAHECYLDPYLSFGFVGGIRAAAGARVGHTHGCLHREPQLVQLLLAADLMIVWVVSVRVAAEVSQRSQAWLAKPSRELVVHGQLCMRQGGIAACFSCTGVILCAACRHFAALHDT